MCYVHVLLCMCLFYYILFDMYYIDACNKWFYVCMMYDPVWTGELYDAGHGKNPRKTGGKHTIYTTFNLINQDLNEV